MEVFQVKYGLCGQHLEGRTFHSESRVLFLLKWWADQLKYSQSIPWVTVPPSGSLGSLQTLPPCARPLLLPMTPSLNLASFLPLKRVPRGGCLHCQLLLPAPDVALPLGLQLWGFCVLTLRRPFPLCPSEASLEWCWALWDRLLTTFPFTLEVTLISNKQHVQLLTVYQLDPLLFTHLSSTALFLL